MVFKTQDAKNTILSNAKKLANTNMKHISIQPDLTPRQRQHDKDLWREAEELNEQMEKEEAKNWEFKPWGPPGMRKVRKLRRQKRLRSESPEIESDQQSQQIHRGRKPRKQANNKH